MVWWCFAANLFFLSTILLNSLNQFFFLLIFQKSAAKPIQPMHVYLSSAPYVGSGAPSSMYMGVPPYGSSLFNGSSLSPYDVPFSGGSAYPYNYGSRLSRGSPYRPLHIACPTPYSSGSMMGNGRIYGMPPLMDLYGLGMGMGMAMGHADMVCAKCPCLELFTN
ncbi:ranBP2-type zinc finger protein At1g67325-like [Camellia sinensis]|uniref:ranBP2-type zinc finger protein At1g67325-like n=1 Tax=Camellia sinensis TaxID=4442 RepID=UPI00103683B7|nr:ranBP2-type zinc finger protein At1g67325-like [Camellia sinensis]